MDKDCPKYAGIRFRPRSLVRFYWNYYYYLLNNEEFRKIFSKVASWDKISWTKEPVVMLSFKSKILYILKFVDFERLRWFILNMYKHFD